MITDNCRICDCEYEWNRYMDATFYFQWVQKYFNVCENCVTHIENAIDIRVDEIIELARKQHDT